MAKADEPQEYAQLNVRIEQAQLQRAPPPPAVAPQLEQRIAILVCHGMGQQVQFETLDTVVREVRETALRCGTLVSKEEGVAVSIHPDDGRFVARAELNLKHTEENGRRVVHFYEAYWAPLTEGRVSMRETLNFLIDAGRRGLNFAFEDGVFDRWMFGGREEFQIPARRVLQLGLGLWMILLVAAGVTATGLLPLMKLLDVFRVGRTDPQLAVTAAVAFSIGIFLGLFALGAVLIAWLLGTGADVARPKSAIDAPIGILASPLSHRIGMALGLIGFIFLSGSLTVWVGIKLYRGWILPAVTDSASHMVGVVAAILLFVAQVILFRRFVKNFLVEFAGDVAAYVAPYKVSAFEEIRHAIQDRGRRVARFIYSATDPESGSLLYDQIFVVGHSLGSVLAYDTLNDAINRDTHAGGWAPGSAADAYRVLDRTRLLLTFGSPLDKTAFVFRTQKTEREIDVREALAGAQQPLIMSYAMRRARWINLWSPSDWISGSIGYYDSPQPLSGQAVCNIENPGSKRPDKAHTQYWSGPLFRGVLHTALTGVCPDDVPEPQRSAVISALA